MEILLFALFFLISIIFFIAGKDDFGRKEKKPIIKEIEEIKNEFGAESEEEKKNELNSESKEEDTKAIELESNEFGSESEEEKKNEINSESKE